MLWVLKRTVSFEHQKLMLKLMGKKIFTILRSNIARSEQSSHTPGSSHQRL